MLAYEPIIGIIGLGAIVLCVVFVLFFNVSYFIIFVFPLIFLIRSHYFILTLSCLLIVAFLAGRLRAGRMSIKFAYPVLFAVLIIFGINGAVRAVDTNVGRYMLAVSLVLPMMIFLVYYNLNPSTGKIYLNFFVILFLAASLGWFSFGRYFIVGYTRQVTGWSHNAAACFFGMIIPYAIISLLDAKNLLMRISWWYILLGVCAGLFVTQSRALYLTSVIALILIALKDRRALKVMLPIIIAALVVVPSLILYRMAMIFGYGDTPDWSSVGRIEIWTNTLKFIPEYYLFGMGFESFRDIYPIYFPQRFIKAEHPHNLYVRWLLEFGIFGAAAYFALIFGVLRRSLRHIPKKNITEWLREERILFGISVGVTSAMIAALVDSYFHHVVLAIFLWMNLALQLILVRRIREIRGLDDPRIEPPGIEQP